MRRLIPTLSLFAFAALTGLVGSSACTVTTGGPAGTGNGFDDTPQSPNTQPSNPSCNECLFQACSGSWTVCQGSSECMAIYQCAIQPNCASDGQCVRSCYDAHASGQNAYTALYTCDQAFACGGCSSECAPSQQSCSGVTPAYAPTPTADAGTTVPDSGTTTVPDSGTTQTTPTDCNGCTDAKCATQKAGCAAGSDCDAYSQCVSACTDAACVTNCESSHQDGKNASDQLATCTTSQCATECGL